MISLDHLHPMLVHFPIALILIGFLADLISLFYKKEAGLSMVGFYLLIIGTLSALIALLSGALFTSEMTGAAGDVKETHELFAWITVINLILYSAYRIFIKVKGEQTNMTNRISFAWYGIAALFVSITGFYGGTLVYSYMMPL
ncbi:MAG: DUF2231 domain-containing protein [Candidatus Saccharibacteria bacterium]